MKDLVSIITASYNAEKFICDTIDSVLNQTYTNLELIIVDDYSSDSTEEIVKKYTQMDERVRYIRLEENSGAAVARNVAIETAKGRYIAFLDSDDLWDEDKLEKQINFMKKMKVGFTFTSYRLISEAGELLNKEVKVPEIITYEGLLKNTVIGCLTVVIDKELTGDFRMPLVRAGQDTATWLSILKKGVTAYGIDEVLASYRKVNGSISSNKFKALKRTWHTYRVLEGISLVKSIYYFNCYIFNAILKRF